MIPQTEIDPIGQKLLNYYPKPNQAGDPGIGTNNYRDVILSGDNSVQFDVKLDQNFSERSRLNVRYSYSAWQRQHADGLLRRYLQ